MVTRVSLFVVSGLNFCCGLALDFPSMLGTSKIDFWLDMLIPGVVVKMLLVATR